MDSTKRIIFVPGINPKPPLQTHREQVLRCLYRSVGRADPVVAQAMESQPELLSLAAWNPLYYQSFRQLDRDLPWIDALLAKSGPTPEEVQAVLGWRLKIARAVHRLADFLPRLIPMLPYPAAQQMILETARYFSNENNIGDEVRELLMAPLRRMFADGDHILLIGHSMGSVIAYDALWALWHKEHNTGRIDMLLTLGSPLGMRFTQKRLLSAHATGRARYPGNISRWVNVAARGDLTALNPHLGRDFKPMVELGLTQSIVDIHGDVFNYFCDDRGLNVHRAYGYLVNPRVGEVIANWWKHHEGAS